MPLSLTALPQIYNERGLKESRESLQLDLVGLGESWRGSVVIA